MKSVLVTGVAGFLGSHIARHHLDNGDHVWGVDNFSSSKMGSRHFQDLMTATRFGFRNVSVCDELFESWQGRFDTIYNFACPASPPRYQEIPIETMLTCTLGTHRVLTLAQRMKARVVHASTSEVYGDPTVSPQPETYRGCVNSYGPRSCYDEGKRAAEALCYDHLNKHGVDARLVRIFNTYGPNMDPDDGRVVSNLIMQALRGEDLTVYGDGKQTRSFCYVDDLVTGIVALGALERNPGTPVNVGNPNEFTVLELAREVQERLGGRIVFRDLPKDDPMQRCPDVSRARELLGWEPKVQLSEGLERTIGYFRSVKLC